MARMFKGFKWLNRRLGAIIASVIALVGVFLFQKAISLLFFSRIVIPSSWNVPVNETASLILRSVILLMEHILVLKLRVEKEIALRLLTGPSKRIFL